MRWGGIDARCVVVSSPWEGIMKTPIALLICLLIARVAAAGTGTPAQSAVKDPPAQTDGQSPRPVLTLMEQNPWLMVIGSDSPTFALYDDGTVIFLKRAGEGDAVLQTTRLRPEELKAFTDSVPLKELSDLPRSDYVASSATDQTTTVIHAWRDGQRKSVSVYGNVRSGVERSKRQAGKVAPEDDVVFINMKSVPQSFSDTVQRLTRFDHPRAERWVPPEIEVMIWPYEYAPDA